VNVRVHAGHELKEPDFVMTNLGDQLKTEAAAEAVRKAIAKRCHININSRKPIQERG